MIKVGIIGGAGYTAGELVRILIHHPDVEIVQVVSSSQAGKKLYEIHHDLVGSTELEFVEQLSHEVDIVYLCQGHGRSKKYLTENLLPEGVNVIDLSQDFRHQSNTQFNNREFIFGLPEVNKATISEATAVANPGCFATAIMLGLLPLAKNELLNEVHIHALTGSTGAGQGFSATSHFSYRHSNVSIYKPFEHQHLVEIRETLGTGAMLNFIPIRGAFTRGIFASMYLETNASLTSIQKLYQDFYAHAVFTHLSDHPVHLKQVVNTNNCILHVEKVEDKLLIISVIDNLLKGASGQAVQNMNLMYGLDESTGLKLKGSFF